MKATTNTKELIITTLIKTAGYSAIVFVIVIFLFLLTEGLPALAEVSLDGLFSTRWYPIEEYYGILPLIAGTLLVTIGAALIAVPVGVGTAIYIAEVAPRSVRELLKPLVEVMAGVPSVVLGFIGIIVLAAALRTILDLPTGLTAFAGSLLLGAISIPTIVSVAEDALDAVPRAYRDAALALGATRWQTVRRVLVPAARNGLLAAVLLGVGRAIGETMAVLMATGHSARIPQSIFDPVQTLTATIAAELGEARQGSEHYQVLFILGVVLFSLTFVVNLVADFIVKGVRKS